MWYYTIVWGNYCETQSNYLHECSLKAGSCSYRNSTMRCVGYAAKWTCELVLHCMQQQFSTVRTNVHVHERWEGRKKEASKVKQTNKAKQHSTPKAVTFPRKNELPRVELEPTTLYTLDMYMYSHSLVRSLSHTPFFLPLSSDDTRRLLNKDSSHNSYGSSSTPKPAKKKSLRERLCFRWPDFSHLISLAAFWKRWRTVATSRRIGINSPLSNKKFCSNRVRYGGRCIYIWKWMYMSVHICVGFFTSMFYFLPVQPSTHCWRSRFCSCLTSSVDTQTCFSSVLPCYRYMYMCM